eukprot:4141626-Pleurochrysis_carterae.AAC.2
MSTGSESGNTNVTLNIREYCIFRTIEEFKEVDEIEAKVRACSRSRKERGGGGRRMRRCE